MNVKRYVMAALAAFVFLQAFEFLWHGLLLHDLYYEPTKQLWRPESEMGAFFPVAVAVGLLFAAVVAFIFTRHYENRGPGEGLRFGLYIGLLIGLVMFDFYPYLPIPLGLAVLWFVGGVIEGVGMGLVLALVYRAESSRPAAGA